MFVTVIDVFPVSSSTSVVITELYCSGTSTSSTVYTTGVPFVEFLSKPSQVLAHPFDSSSVTGSPNASPSAVNCTLIDSGL